MQLFVAVNDSGNRSYRVQYKRYKPGMEMMRTQSFRNRHNRQKIGGWRVKTAKGPGGIDR